MEYMYKMIKDWKAKVISVGCDETLPILLREDKEILETGSAMVPCFGVQLTN